MTRFFLILLALGAVAAAIWLFPRDDRQSVHHHTGSPIPTGDAVVMVQGWSEDELDVILSEFARLYSLSPHSLKRLRKMDGTSEITNVHPIEGALLLFLVNYLHYPRGFDLQARDPAVVARVRLADSTGAPEALLDRTAEIYVPENDTRYDEVYVRLAEDEFFRVSFSRGQWMRVEDGREPPAMRRLTATTP